MTDCPRSFSRQMRSAALLMALVAMPAVPAPPPTAGKSVDTCGLLTDAEVESVLGPLAGKPMVLPWEDALRSECLYTSRDETLGLSIGTAPAGEFDITVQRQSKDRNQAPIAVPGLGQKAFLTPYALLIQPTGKPYFLTVAVLNASGAVDAAKTRAIAGKLKF